MPSNKSTPAGGKPRKDGTTAKPQLVDAKGRKYKDTPENRRKLGMMPDGVTPKETPPEKTQPSGPQDAYAGNEDAVRRALEAGMVPGATAVPGAPAAPGPEVPQINYEQVVAIVNMVLTSRWPDACMTSDEQKAIGTSLDAVIAKHWPNMKNAGPEVALAVAIIGYATRAFLLPMLKRDDVPPSDDSRPPS